MPGTHHSWIKHYGHQNWGNDHQVVKALDCQTNSPCQHHEKCIEKSVENMLSDVRVWRVKSSSVVSWYHFISSNMNILWVFIVQIDTFFCFSRVTFFSCDDWNLCRGIILMIFFLFKWDVFCWKPAKFLATYSRNIPSTNIF